MLKKSISALLVVTFLLSVFIVFPFSANAATSGKTGDCTWAISNGTLTISGNGKMKDYGIYSDADRSPWYSNRTSIKTIVVNNGVTNIGTGAFYDCTNMTSISFANSVKSIGDYAVRHCTNMKSVTIPDSVTSIGKDSFFYCKNLKTVIIGNAVKTIGDTAFCSCENLTSVTIPSSVTKIGDLAFYDCSHLENVYYGGSKEDWNKITIGTNNEKLTSASIQYIGSKSKELDFSKDVWNFKNYTDSRCSLEDELSNGYYTNPYIGKLKPSSRAIVKAELENGSKGHCFGMSTTVIMQKLGMIDLTVWDYVDYLRQVGGMGVPRSRICYFHTMQVLWDFKQEVYDFFDHSVSEQLAILAERADNVKSGGNPVLLCFGKEGWGAHAVVAYALEPGSFVSSTTGKKYDRRILIYDCNNVDWSADFCLLFNRGTDEWEIPHYAKNKVTSYDGAYLMCAAVNTSVYDAIDDYEQEYDLGYCPVLTVNCSDSIRMTKKTTGEEWIINSKTGKITGSTELFSYFDFDILDATEAAARINVFLPDSKSEYIFETVTGKSTDIELNVSYSDRFLSVESESAKGAVVSSDGTIVVNDNDGRYQIVATSDSMQNDESYDTFTVIGKNKGDTTVSLSDSGITVAGNSLQGVLVEASNATDAGTSLIDGNKVVELNNDTNSYSTLSMGDTDGDGLITIMDATVIQRDLAELSVFYFNRKVADVDNDGKVTVLDTTRIQRFLAQICNLDGTKPYNY